uniref:Uncharacterized protein n=1 Tax=Arundo donax TaxID=35708 RepID=A0A0A9BFB7_ARUDO
MRADSRSPAPVGARVPQKPLGTLHEGHQLITRTSRGSSTTFTFGTPHEGRQPTTNISLGSGTTKTTWYTP